MNIIFFGSDNFALVNLQRLIEAGYHVPVCITPPDRPKGRGLKLTASPVKTFALERGMEVLQPEDIGDKEFAEYLRNVAADLFVVISYGKLLPQELLDVPKNSALNVHASLLPQYRGAAPVNWAILNGEKTTGISVIKLVARMDAGDVLAREEIEIEDDDTAVTLRAKLALLGAGTLCRVIEEIEKEEVSSHPQDEKQASFAPKLKKQLGLISWNNPALEIHNQVRGLQPWPGAYTFFQTKRIKVLESAVIPTNTKGRKCGEVLDVSSPGLLVAAKQNALLITTVQPESGRPMDGAAFAAGYHVETGQCLGE